MNTPDPFALQCPLPLRDYPVVTLAHGGGGRLMHELIEGIFLAAFDNPLLRQRHDGALLPACPQPLALTTDSYVVHPLFFPGGNIGTLAVNGTVNDLAMCGARPLYLTAGFVIEEGLPMADLWRVACSMREAAARAGVSIVTGDTKVVDRGKGDGLYLNTAGVGAVVLPGRPIAPVSVMPGDAILLSGDIGRHGVAIMAVREELDFEEAVESDCAPLAAPVMALLENGIEVHCLRDLTRGGLAGALVEIAAARGVHLQVDQALIPVGAPVAGACELLGLDPLYVANEGRFVAFVAAGDAERALDLLRGQPGAPDPRRIGRVAAQPSGRVTLKNLIGSHRILDLPSGEQLPRIC